MKVKNIRKYLTEEQITERVKAMGEQISRDYGGETVYLICILKGSIFFTCELAKRITSPVEIDFMSVSSYGAGTSSSGVVKIGKDLDTTIEGKNVRKNIKLSAPESENKKSKEPEVMHTVR